MKNTRAKIVQSQSIDASAFRNISKWWIYFIGIPLLLNSCTIPDAQPQKKSVVTVYTDHLGTADSLIFAKFYKEEKIKVYYRILPSDSILEVIEQEKYNSKADLILLHGADQLLAAQRKKLFAPLHSEKITAEIDKNYLSKKGFWTALSKTPIVIAYDQRILKKDTVKTYNDLLTTNWKQKVALQHPDYPTLEVLNRSISTLKIRKVNLFLPKLVNQAYLKKEGEDLTQLKRIHDWKAQLAVVELSSIVKANAHKTNKRDTLNMPFSKSIGVIFPNQTKKGCFYNITGAGIYRYARNPMQARKLLEFLASKRAQYQFAAGRFEYPVVKNINPHYLLDPIGKYRARFVLNK